MFQFGPIMYIFEIQSAETALNIDFQKVCRTC